MGHRRKAWTREDSRMLRRLFPSRSRGSLTPLEVPLALRRPSRVAMALAVVVLLPAGACVALMIATAVRGGPLVAPVASPGTASIVTPALNSVATLQTAPAGHRTRHRAAPIRLASTSADGGAAADPDPAWLRAASADPPEIVVPR